MLCVVIKVLIYIGINLCISLVSVLKNAKKILIWLKNFFIFSQIGETNFNPSASRECTIAKSVVCSPSSYGVCNGTEPLHRLLINSPYVVFANSNPFSLCRLC